MLKAHNCEHCSNHVFIHNMILFCSRTLKCTWYIKIDSVDHANRKIMKMEPHLWFPGTKICSKLYKLQASSDDSVSVPLPQTVELSDTPFNNFFFTITLKSNIWSHQSRDILPSPWQFPHAFQWKIQVYLFIIFLGLAYSWGRLSWLQQASTRSPTLYVHLSPKLFLRLPIKNRGIEWKKKCGGVEQRTWCCSPPFLFLFQFREGKSSWHITS